MKGMSAASKKQWAKLGVRAGVFILMAFVLAAVLLYPAWLSLDRTRARLSALEGDLAEQEALLPLRASILSQKRDMPEVDVVVPELQPISRMQIFTVRERLSDVVRTARMEPLEVNMNALDVQPGAEEVAVDFVAAGDSADIRTLFVAVASLPYVKQIERFEVRAVRGGVEVFMGLRLAVRKVGVTTGGQAS